MRDYRVLLTLPADVVESDPDLSRAMLNLGENRKQGFVWRNVPLIANNGSSNTCCRAELLPDEGEDEQSS